MPHPLLALFLAGGLLAGCATESQVSRNDAAPAKDEPRSPEAPAFSLSEAPPASALSVTRTDPLPQAKAGAPTMLGAFTVSERPLQSFGFSVRIVRDSITHQVEQITVDRVLPDSPAAAAGLGPLTSIRKINDKPVEDYLGSLERGSELFKLLMNRKSGDQITLEVLDMASTVPRVVTLTQRLLNVNAQNLDGVRMSSSTSSSDRLSPDEGHAH